jgi:hypothetical protein
MPLRALACGPWSFLFSEEDGALRHLRFEGVEVLRGIYAALRDADWHTLEPRLADLRIEETPRACAIAFTADCARGDIRFAWRGEIRLEADGSLDYRFVGRALSDFRRNRIGFCVLHAPGCAGRPCEVAHTDDTRRASVFPDAISPHQPFQNLRALAHSPEPGLRVEVCMEGDTFEMEDQRNWTDASFKTYCTPLGLPFPVAIAAGTEIAQRIAVRVTRLADYAPLAPPADLAPALALPADAPLLPWPALGFGAGAPELPRLNTSDLVALQALRPAHLRVEISPDEPRPAARLDRALSEARWLNARLEIALRLDVRHAATLEAVAAWAAQLSPVAARVARWIVTTASRELDPAALLRAARGRLAPLTPDAAFVGGTDAYFAELNRRRPPLEVCDAVSFSINPQVHAFDDLSLIETLPMQGLVVRDARAFCADRPVLVSPVTLRPRYNPNATTTLAAAPTADPRQRELFAALWTLGSVKHLAEAGAASLTYYRTLGAEGLLDEATGQAFPVWHVFRALAEFAPTHLQPVVESDPLRFAALLLARGPQRRLLVAHFAAGPALRQSPAPADAEHRLLLGSPGAARLEQYDYLAPTPSP